MTYPAPATRVPSTGASHLDDRCPHCGRCAPRPPVVAPFNDDYVRRQRALSLVEDFQRQLNAPMPEGIRTAKLRDLSRCVREAHRAGATADEVLDAQRKGQSLK
jgi:hypothetical protein